MAAAGPQALGGQTTIHAHHCESESMATSPAQLPRILPQGLPQVGSALSLCGGVAAGFPASCGHCQAGSPPGSREVCMGDMGKTV